MRNVCSLISFSTFFSLSKFTEKLLTPKQHTKKYLLVLVCSRSFRFLLPVTKVKKQQKNQTFPSCIIKLNILREKILLSLFLYFRAVIRQLILCFSHLNVCLKIEFTFLLFLINANHLNSLHLVLL